MKKKQEPKKEFKIYYLAKDYILVHHTSPDEYYHIYAKDVDPHSHINVGTICYTANEFNVMAIQSDGNFVVNCPVICKEYDVVIPGTELTEIDLTNARQIFKLMDFLKDFWESAINDIKYLIDFALNHSEQESNKE